MADGPLKTLLGRAMSIVERDEIRQMSTTWFRVWSQSMKYGMTWNVPRRAGRVDAPTTRKDISSASTYWPLT